MHEATVNAIFTLLQNKTFTYQHCYEIHTIPTVLVIYKAISFLVFSRVLVKTVFPQSNSSQARTLRLPCNVGSEAPTHLIHMTNTSLIVWLT